MDAIEEDVNKKSIATEPEKVIVKKKDSGAVFPVKKETAAKNVGGKYVKPTEAEIENIDTGKGKNGKASPEEKSKTASNKTDALKLNEKQLAYLKAKASAQPKGKKGVYDKSLAKLVLKISGQDVSFDKDDLKILNSIGISKSSRNIYFDYGKPVKTEKTNFEDLFGGYNAAAVMLNKYLTDNMQDINKSIPGLDLHNKGGFEGKETSKTFKSTSVLQSMPSFKAKEFNSFVLKQLRPLLKSDEELDSLEMFGEKLDRRDKRTFVNTINEVLDSTIKGTSLGSNEEIEAMNKFVGVLKNTLKGKDPEASLKDFGEKLFPAFVEAFEVMQKNNESSARTFLKDYGETMAYMNLLSQGKEAYMPKNGEFPLADIFVVNENSKVVELISVKSRYGVTKSTGAPSSVKAYIKSLKYKHPDAFKALDQLDTINTTNVFSLNEKSNLSNDDRKAVIATQGVLSLKNHKEAVAALQKSGYSKEAIDQTIWYYQYNLKKIKEENPKFDTSWGNTSKIFAQVAHREYCKEAINRKFKQLNLKIPLDFLIINMSKKGNNISSEGDYSTAEFVAYEKQKLDVRVDEKGKVVGNPAYTGGPLSATHRHVVAKESAFSIEEAIQSFIFRCLAEAAQSKPNIHFVPLK